MGHIIILWHCYFGDRPRKKNRIIMHFSSCCSPHHCTFRLKRHAQLSLSKLRNLECPQIRRCCRTWISQQPCFNTSATDTALGDAMSVVSSLPVPADHAGARFANAWSTGAAAQIMVPLLTPHLFASDAMLLQRRRRSKQMTRRRHSKQSAKGQKRTR